ncbi:MAG: sigma factor-like helix-turn-helix DNA-binding protein, partial [Bacteroidota bacterium]
LNRVSSINKIAKAIPFLEQEFEREPTDKEISDFLEIPEDEVSRMNFIRKKHVSFDKPLSNDGSDEFCLYDLVQTGNVPSTDNDVVNESTSINISRALSKLSKRESDVLVMSFGLFNSPLYSLQDISAKFYVSSERIRQIRAKGLVKLRNLLKNKSAFFEN